MLIYAKIIVKYPPPQIFSLFFKDKSSPEIHPPSSSTLKALKYKQNKEQKGGHF